MIVRGEWRFLEVTNSREVAASSAVALHEDTARAKYLLLPDDDVRYETR